MADRWITLGPFRFEDHLDYVGGSGKNLKLSRIGHQGNQETSVPTVLAPACASKGCATDENDVWSKS
jgi:hypothetical protein